MKLKKLEIYGFKSFADRTEILFEEGITGIVGPNGSGKSNIGDAVRWVLGEQSAKNLRGGKMEDIIFGGTEARKAQKYCEVSLIFDNSDNALHLEYTEIMVTRRVYRSGESEYFLNKTACRLKDIIELFRDTGVGKEGYSLIGQGRIAEILSAKSDDRRRIFEEAAGIVKYRARKEEAQKRLHNTDDNMLRVDDLIDEIGAQREPLQKQAETARAYLQLTEELRGIELAAFARRQEENQEKIAQMNEKQAALIEQQSDLENRLQSASDKHMKAKDDQEKAIAALDAFHGEMLHETRALETAEGALRLTSQQIDYHARDLERYDAEIAQWESVREEGNTENNARAMDIVKSELVEARKRLEEAEKATKVCEMTVEERETALESAKARMIDRMNRMSDMRSAKTRLTTMAQNLEDQKGKLLTALAALESEAPDYDKSGRAAEIALQTAQNQLKALQDETAALDEAVRKVSDDLSRAREEENALRGEITSLTSRIKVLREMKDDYEGYQQSVRRVMKYARERGMEGVHGVVADILKVPKEYERALDMALGGALQNIVVEDENSAKILIQYLRDNNFGRASFLPIKTMRPSSLNARERDALRLAGCRGVASELVQYEAKYKNVVENLLGRTVIAENFDSGVQIQRASGHSFRLVTLLGDVMHSGGKVTGGSQGGRATSFLTRERELIQNQESHRLKGEQLKGKAAEISALADQRSSMKTERQRAFDALHQEEIAVARDTERLEKALSARADFDARLSSHLTEIENIDQMLADIAEEMDLIDSDQNAQNGESEENIEEKTAALAEARSALDSASKTHSGMTLEVFSKEKELEQLERDIKRQEDDWAQAAKKLDKLRAQRETALENQAASVQEREDKTEELRLLRARLNEFTEKRSVLEKQRLDAQEQTEVFSAEMERHRADIQICRDKQHQIELNITRLDGDLKALTERIWEDYALTYEACKEFSLGELTLPQADAKIAELRRDIRALGDVNVHAVEDYRALTERFDELSAQRDDLLAARRDLEGIITELTGRMQKQFAERFALLNGYFAETFARLFGGGKARLYLKDENDVLNCDIEIDAQPPGKKLQLLSLLSGGERALTAIAILFAMLKLKPTPFCILDEIEAALDDANIGHFADYLADYSKNTQFVVVTHRKGTMECCDALYGVTMEEKGISRLLSVQMEQAV